MHIEPIPLYFSNALVVIHSCLLVRNIIIPSLINYRFEYSIIIVRINHKLGILYSTTLSLSMFIGIIIDELHIQVNIFIGYMQFKSIYYELRCIRKQE